MDVNESELLSVPIDVGRQILQRLSLVDRLRVLRTNNLLRQRYLPFFAAEIESERRRLELLNKILSRTDALDYCDTDDITHFQLEYLIKNLDQFSKNDLVYTLADMIFHGAADTLNLFRSTREQIAGLSDDSYTYASYECLHQLTYSELQQIAQEIDNDQ